MAYSLCSHVPTLLQMQRGAWVTITSLTPRPTKEANTITNYNIEFWRGAARVFGYEGYYPNLDDAQHHINELLQEMMIDS